MRLRNAKGQKEPFRESTGIPNREGFIFACVVTSRFFPPNPNTTLVVDGLAFGSRLMQRELQKISISVMVCSAWRLAAKIVAPTWGMSLMTGLCQREKGIV